MKITPYLIVLSSLPHTDWEGTEHKEVMDFSGDSMLIDFEELDGIDWDARVTMSYLNGGSKLISELKSWSNER